MKDRFNRYYLGEMSPEEEAEYRLWLLSHEDDPELEKLMAAAFDDLSSLNETVSDAEVPAGKFSAGRTSAGRKLSRSRFLPLAAVLLFLLCLPLSFLLGRKSGKEAMEPVVAEVTRRSERIESLTWLEKRVPVGSTDTLLLSDGSVFYLNSGSRVTYPEEFTGSQREIFIDGEVFAKVSHDPEHPFLVRSGDTRVQVLGTTFNFKSYSTDRCVECLLLEGSVKMSIASHKGPREVLMKPGNMVQFDRSSGDVAIGDFKPELFRSFRDGGALHFYNLTMADIAADLERRFGEQVVVLDSALAGTRFFAIFNNHESLDRILRAMSSDGRMRVRYHDGAYRLSSAK